MKNIDLLKKVLCDQISQKTAEELYELILQPMPLISGLCKYCRPLWGDCPETIKDDSICIWRFVKWCEQEIDQMNSVEQVIE